MWEAVLVFDTCIVHAIFLRSQLPSELSGRSRLYLNREFPTGPCASSSDASRDSLFRDSIAVVPSLPARDSNACPRFCLPVCNWLEEPL